MDAPPATIKDFEGVFSNVLGLLIGLGAIIFFIMLVLGGFSIMSSGGDPKALETGKKTITYAIGGIILLALSLLVFKVVEAFTGVDLLKFTIYQR